MQSLISDISSAEVHKLKFPAPFHPLILVSATGHVPTTGWSRCCLSPKYYLVPPTDGIWDFDFIGDSPSGIVGEVVLRVSAQQTEICPNWCKGVRVHAKTGSKESLLSAGATIGAIDHSAVSTVHAGHIIINQHLANYEDSWQPTGRTKFNPWPHVEMKKLVHDLTLVVEGPNADQIHSCINKAFTAGLIAAIIAATATLGLALQAAISAFVAFLEGCLGGAYTVKINNSSHWVYWWT